MSRPSGPRVLITEGGSGESRAALAAVRTLAAAGYRPVVTVSGEWSFAGASRHCHATVRVPFVREDPDAYAAAVRAETAAREYLTVLPANDLAHLALELPGREFLDKTAVAEIAGRAGLAVPPTRVFESAAAAREAAGGLEYPVAVKPAVKHALAARARSAGELERALEPLGEAPAAILVQPWLPDPLHGVVGLVHGGRLVRATHLRYLRVWPLPCGTVAAAETAPLGADLEARLEALLAGYDGVFHVDLAGPWLLDLNPRIHATLPLARAAGADPVVARCDLLAGVRTTPGRGRAGVFYRWLEGDLRSVARTLREGGIGPRAAVAALRPRRGTVHSLWSLDDPAPLWARFRFLGRRLRTGEPYGVSALARRPA